MAVAKIDTVPTPCELAEGLDRIWISSYAQNAVVGFAKLLRPQRSLSVRRRVTGKVAMDTDAEAQGGAQSDSAPISTPPARQAQESDSPALRAIRRAESKTRAIRQAYPFGSKAGELDRRTEAAFHFSGLRDPRENLPPLRTVRPAVEPSEPSRGAIRPGTLGRGNRILRRTIGGSEIGLLPRWERFVRRFVKSNIEAQEQHTQAVIEHAKRVRFEAERMLRLGRRRRMR